MAGSDVRRTCGPANRALQWRAPLAPPRGRHDHSVTMRCVVVLLLVCHSGWMQLAALSAAAQGVVGPTPGSAGRALAPSASAPPRPTPRPAAPRSAAARADGMRPPAQRRAAAGGQAGARAERASGRAGAGRLACFAPGAAQRQYSFCFAPAVPPPNGAQPAPFPACGCVVVSEVLHQGQRSANDKMDTGPFTYQDGIHLIALLPPRTRLARDTAAVVAGVEGGLSAAALVRRIWVGACGAAGCGKRARPEGRAQWRGRGRGSGGTWQNAVNEPRRGDGRRGDGPRNGCTTQSVKP